MRQFPEYKKVSTDSLIPYIRNSRTHSDEQVAQIAASIKEFGFTNPILIDSEGGIIAGHGRVMAARKLGISEVPSITLDHLTDAQKRAYIIADNKLVLNGGWNEDMLRIEFAELEDMGFDLELTGFSLDEIEDIDLGAPSERELDDSKYTTKIETPIYEMKGKEPEISELYNTDKTGDLTKRIMAADLPDDLRGFLLAAATRHTVFNYENIAEFYAHQDREVQEFMEQSALVIIDYNKAIEDGYVRLTKALMQLSGESDNVTE